MATRAEIRVPRPNMTLRRQPPRVVSPESPVAFEVRYQITDPATGHIQTQTRVFFNEAQPIGRSGK